MEPADFYTGIVVDAYARLKSSTFHPGPYADFVRTHGEPALEVGCGHGEPLLDLCAAGLDVDGVDSSADMVDRCRARARARGVSTHVHHQRVEELDLDRTYSSIYLAGPTFNLLPDDTTAASALRAIGRHLAVDGAALVPLWVPPPTPDEELGVTRAADDGAGVEVRYTPLSETYDRDRRTRTTATRYERVTQAGVEVADRQWILHWHTPESFEALCDEAGLRVVELVDDDTCAPAHGRSSSFTSTLRRVRRSGASGVGRHDGVGRAGPEHRPLPRGARPPLRVPVLPVLHPRGADPLTGADHPAVVAPSGSQRRRTPVPPSKGSPR